MEELYNYRIEKKKDGEESRLLSDTFESKIK